MLAARLLYQMWIYEKYQSVPAPEEASVRACSNVDQSSGFVTFGKFMVMTVNMLPRTPPKEPGPITLRNLNAQRPCLKKTPSSKGPCLAVSLKEPCRPLPFLFPWSSYPQPTLL